MKRAHHTGIALLLGMLLTIWVFPAAAGGESARELFNEGVEFFRNDKFLDAANAFERAYALKPTYRLLFNIGQAYAATQKYDLAIQAFERYLLDGGDNVPQDRRDEVLKETARLRPLVGFLDVIAPEGLNVQVNGSLRGKTPLRGTLMLTVGRQHKIEFLKNAKVVIVRIVRVQSGLVESIDVREKPKTPDHTAPVKIVPEEEKEPIIEPQVMEEEEKGMSKPKIWGWITAGTGAAVLAAGGVFGGLALSQNGKLEKACPDIGCSPARQGEVDALGTMALTSDILFGAGGALVVTGLILLLLPEKGEEIEQEEKEGPQVTFTPIPGGFAADVTF